jgi:RNA polymerase sigma-70 factor (ECF subfamily)
MGRSPDTYGIERNMTPAFLAWVTELVHRHRGRLVAVARGEGLLAEDALDCVQEAFHTFLLLPQARALVEVPDDSIRLLTVIARNAARNRRRRGDRARPHDGDMGAIADASPPADELIAQADEHVRLRGCVNKLGELSRKVVSMRMLDEVPGEDVAAMLGLTPGHVAVLLHRAKASLRVCMECPDQETTT